MKRKSMLPREIVEFIGNNNNWIVRNLLNIFTFIMLFYLKLLDVCISAKFKN